MTQYHTEKSVNITDVSDYYTNYSVRVWLCVVMYALGYQW